MSGNCVETLKNPLVATWVILGENMAQKVRHLLGLSGGKDSSALAVYMRDKVPRDGILFL